MKLNWNFLGDGGSKTKNLPWGEYGYFLELHNGAKGLLFIYLYLKNNTNDKHCKKKHLCGHNMFQYS